MDYQFAAPQRWCDLHCPGCPLAADCSLHTQFDGKRWPRPASADDPSDLPAAMRAAAETLARAATLLRCDAEGRAAATGEGSRRARRLRAAGRDYLCAVTRFAMALGCARRDADPDVGEAIRYAALVAPKMAALGALLNDEGRPAAVEQWRAEAVPNLLLVEHADIAVAVALAPWGLEQPVGEGVRHARERLWQQIGRWIDAVPERAREALAARIAAGAAPSPFVQASAERGPDTDAQPVAAPRARPPRLAVVPPADSRGRAYSADGGHSNSGELAKNVFVQT